MTESKWEQEDLLRLRIRELLEQCEIYREAFEELHHALYHVRCTVCGQKFGEDPRGGLWEKRIGVAEESAQIMHIECYDPEMN